MKSFEVILLRISFIAFALTLVLPLVSFEVGEATSTRHVGSRGAKGILFVGIYQSQFDDYPIGGTVTCNYPTGNALVQVKEIYCDLGQVTLPIFMACFFLIVLCEGIVHGKWLQMIKWGFAVVLWGLSLGVLIIAQDKATYLNTGSITNESISYGGILVICALVALPLAGLASLKNSSSSDYLNLPRILQESFF